MSQYSSTRPFLLAKLILFLALALLLLVVDQRDQAPERGWLLTLVYPVQALGRAPENLWFNLQDYLRTRSALQAENARLQREMARMRPHLLRLMALEQENKRLLTLLGAAQRTPGRTLLARVVGASSDPSSHVITIDRGSRDGVFAGQAAMAASGVVGQVVRVGPVSSQVTLLTDPGQSLPAQVLRTRKNVLVNGNGDPLKLSIPFLPHNADIRVGDVLLTSGLGGLFPKGLPVGRVVSIDRGSGRVFADAAVLPWVKMDRLEEILLLWPPAEPTAGSRGDLAAGQAPQ